MAQTQTINRFFYGLGGKGGRTGALLAFAICITIYLYWKAFVHFSTMETWRMVWGIVDVVLATTLAVRIVPLVRWLWRK